MTSLRQLSISGVTRETDAIVSIELECSDGSPLPEWTPGAHLEVHLPSGKSRQYSLCGDPADRSRYEIAVLRDDEGRGGSVELHALAAVGQMLTVREPRNNFPLMPGDHHLFLAGGIGLTPILPMIAAAEASGSDWHLVYGGRTRKSMAFLERLAKYDSARVEVIPQDEFGLPPLDEKLGRVPSNGHIYCCGPSGMISAVADLHAARGHDPELHVERFAADPDAVGDKAGDAFEVELVRSGVAVAVGEDQTIIEAVRPILADVPFSCEEGYCGSCEVTVLEGEPDHRDTYLTDDEKAANDTMMICVSRSRSSLLKLDL